MRCTKSFKRRKCSRLGFSCRTKIHRNAVLHDFVLIQDLIQDTQRSSAINHEVFGYYFEPIHDRFAREDMMIMRSAQSYTDPVIRLAVKSIGRHSWLR